MHAVAAQETSTSSNGSNLMSVIGIAIGAGIGGLLLLLLLTLLILRRRRTQKRKTRPGSSMLQSNMTQNVLFSSGINSEDARHAPAHQWQQHTNPLYNNLHMHRVPVTSPTSQWTDDYDTTTRVVDPSSSSSSSQTATSGNLLTYAYEKDMLGHGGWSDSYHTISKQVKPASTYEDVNISTYEPNSVHDLPANSQLGDLYFRVGLPQRILQETSLHQSDPTA